MSHRLQVLIPEGLDSRLAKAAQRARQSKGEWVRQALERVLSDGLDSKDALSELALLGAPTADIDQMLAEIEAGRR
jgi:predicted transcriptional regulator